MGVKHLYTVYALPTKQTVYSSGSQSGATPPMGAVKTMDRAVTSKWVIGG